MKIAISGSRTFSDLKFMTTSLEGVIRQLGEQQTAPEIWSGGAKGADALAETAARQLGLPFHEIKADWAKFGRAAGPKRNAQLVAECDILIAFPVGESKGTRGCIQLARKAGKKVFVFESL
jgi:hypothetical protein